ncbi:MAG: metalloprotease TldD [Woeseiaceae bacterium]|nr:metalloprotease TldD [Woeseiaceae bacterium]MDG1864566.1 metalloprotease TldD [Woeseiaceae bacterium]
MQTSTFKTVKAAILDTADLVDEDIKNIAESIQGKGIDIADLYFQIHRQETWVMEDGKIKEGAFSLDKGVGVRAVSGDKTGFAYSDDLSIAAIKKAAQATQSIARLGQSSSANISEISQISSRYPSIDPLISISEQKKIDLIKTINELARNEDSRVQQVNISLSSSQDMILIAAADMPLVADIRPLVRLNVSVILEENNRREQGYAGGGARSSLDYFMDNTIATDLAKEAIRLAGIQLKAKPAPAGSMPVVLGSGWPGILLHEAVGHGLEGDFNRKGVSTFSGRIGDQVASKLCTIVDDGTLVNRRGSLAIDDEGIPGQYNVLIKDGILKGYMQDRMNSKLMGVPTTGNGRRESYAHIPMPRMTNTYMLAGPHDHDEIIASVKKGIYAPNFSGGQVDITSGKFVFSANEAYMIEDGKISFPLKGAMLIGDGPDVLGKISMVGNNLELDAGVGTCGKEGQSVPVGVGQPTLKIDEITVGGTA